MRTRCRICEKFYITKHRGWYEYYVPPVCSLHCFSRLCGEGYPELRIDPKTDARIQNFVGLSDRSFRSDYERAAWTALNHVHCKVEYEPYSFKVADWCRYVPDFLVASRVFLEVKGLWMGDGKKKFLAFREEFPDFPIYVVDKQFLDLLKRTSK